MRSLAAASGGFSISIASDIDTELDKLNQQIQPSVENRLPVNSAISVLFRVYHLPGRAEECDLVASPKLLGEKGEQFVLPPINLKEVMSPAGPAEAAIGLRLPFQSVPPGKYRLVIEVKETGSAQTATLQTNLEFF